MKGHHVSFSDRGHISAEYYVQADAGLETDLISRSGNFTVEAIWFDQGLRSITVYSGGPNSISGISAQTSSETYCVGICNTNPKTIFLNAPEEILTEVDVWTSIRSLAISVSLMQSSSRVLSSWLCS